MTTRFIARLPAALVLVLAAAAGGADAAAGIEDLPPSTVGTVRSIAPVPGGHLLRLDDTTYVLRSGIPIVGPDDRRLDEDALSEGVRVRLDVKREGARVEVERVTVVNE